jgi:hypothetical protein
MPSTMNLCPRVSPLLTQNGFENYYELKNLNVGNFWPPTPFITKKCVFNIILKPECHLHKYGHKCVRIYAPVRAFVVLV